MISHNAFLTTGKCKWAVDETGGRGADGDLEDYDGNGRRGNRRVGDVMLCMSRPIALDGR